MPSQTEKEKFRRVESIIFDMDGVVTSESDYWCAAEMTVLELLYGKQFLAHHEPSVLTVLHKPGVAVKMNRYVSDAFIALLKNNGINTNWDLAYLALVLYLIDCLAGIKNRERLTKILNGPLDSGALYEISTLIDSKTYPVEHIDTASAYFTSYRLRKAEERLRKGERPSSPEEKASVFFDDINAWSFERTGLENLKFKRGDALWLLCKDIFQEWYLGDSLIQDENQEKISNIRKDGMIWMEDPIIPLQKIISSFALLKEAGIKFGIATGRPYKEIMIPLHKWGLLHFFESSRISTYREIKEAEDHLAAKGTPRQLPKPNPYVYLRAIFPEKSIDELLEMKLPLDKEFAGKIVIVGDSLSDLMAAKTIGCLSAVVMTGVIDLETASLMKQYNPDFVLENVSCFENLF